MPAAQRRPKKRIRLETDERRAQILGLAKQAFSERSYDEVSIDDLATEAKISKGLLYHYFPTKRDLYIAGLTQIADELCSAIEAVPVDPAPIERVRASIDTYLDHVTRQARAFVSLMRGGIGSDPEVATVIADVRRRLFQTFLLGSPFEALLASDPKFAVAIRGWMGFVEATSLEWCAHDPKQQRPMTREQLRELLVGVLFETIKLVVPPFFKR